MAWDRLLAFSASRVGCGNWARKIAVWGSVGKHSLKFCSDAWSTFLSIFVFTFVNYSEEYMIVAKTK